MLKKWIQEYINAQMTILESFPAEKVMELIEVLKMANLEGRQVFVFGNGGSAANASHFITDLGKSVAGTGIKKFKCRSMNESDAWMTAIGNDFSYEHLFCKQLENCTNSGDIILVMSVSGTSPNILKAVEWSKSNGLYVIALVGQKETPLTSLADQIISIPDHHYGRVEDTHMLICHVLAYAFIENPDLIQQSDFTYNECI
ncbi:MAG: SIS domain-containing protein [Bacteroidales bacterium]|jgi:D-sedoheptulose 7-phosphate isomerase